VTSPLLTRVEAAAFLGVSLRTFALHVQSELQTVRVGRCVRIRREALDAWVAKQEDGCSDSDTESGASDSVPTVDSASQAPATASTSSGKPHEPLRASIRIGSSTPDHDDPSVPTESLWERVLDRYSRRSANG
jgi:excisionase family DNA binding protein